MKLRITVEGQAYDVEVEVLDDAPASAPTTRSASAPAAASSPPAPARPEAKPAKPAPAGNTAGAGGTITAPIGGTVTQVRVSEGDEVAANDVVAVLEAMKMESNIAAPAAGTVKTIKVKPGDSVQQGQVLIELA